MEKGNVGGCESRSVTETYNIMYVPYSPSPIVSIVSELMGLC